MFHGDKPKAQLLTLEGCCRPDAEDVELVGGGLPGRTKLNGGLNLGIHARELLAQPRHVRGAGRLNTTAGGRHALGLHCP